MEKPKRKSDAIVKKKQMYRKSFHHLRKSASQTNQNQTYS